MISGALENLRMLGVQPKMELQLQGEHQKYRAYHREWVFKGV